MNTKALLFLFTFFLVSNGWAIETGTVNEIGTGKDSAEAVSNLLSHAVPKHFKKDAPLIRSILQNEILPNASSFVQSYRQIEGGSGSTSISADLDLDLLRGLFSLTPQGLGEGTLTRAVIAVKGVRIADLVAKGNKELDPYAVLEAAAKDRFQRRRFEIVKLSTEEISEAGINEDVAGPEFLRGLGAKSNARLALGISIKIEKVKGDGEHTHGEEERVFLTGTLLDVKTGITLGHSSENFLNPKTRKDLYFGEFQKGLLEDGRSLLQDLFVSGGKKLFGSISAQISVLRVQYPSNPILLNKFRLLLEGVKGWKSVTEYRVQRGYFDFAIRPALETPQLLKLVQGIVSEEIQIESEAFTIAGDADAHPPKILVKLTPKMIVDPTAPISPEREAPNE